MGFVLQIIGGVAVLIILILIAIYIFYRIKFGKYLHDDPDTNQTPLCVHLNEDFSADWLNLPRSKELSTELIELGFTPSKAYFIYEMDGYFLQVFIKDPIVSVLYWHEKVGNWVDMVVDEVDGKEYTFSNAPMGSEISERPECIKKFDVSASVSDLYNRMSEVISGSTHELVKVTSDGFREYFENSFKKDISWKNRNGGISYDEFLAIADAAPFSSSDKNIKESFIETKVSELDQWHDAVLNEYRISQNIDEGDFFNIEYNFLIVPYTTNATAYITYLSDKCLVKEDQVKPLSELYEDETDIFKLFDIMNEAVSPDLRATFIESVDYPLPIKLFKLSDNIFSQI